MEKIDVARPLGHASTPSATVAHAHVSARPETSLIGWSAGRRVAWAAVAVAVLWLAVGWALDRF